MAAGRRRAPRRGPPVVSPRQSEKRPARRSEIHLPSSGAKGDYRGGKASGGRELSTEPQHPVPGCCSPNDSILPPRLTISRANNCNEDGRPIYFRQTTRQADMVTEAQPIAGRRPALGGGFVVDLRGPGGGAYPGGALAMFTLATPSNGLGRPAWVRQALSRRAALPWVRSTVRRREVAPEKSPARRFDCHACLRCAAKKGTQKETESPGRDLPWTQVARGAPTPAAPTGGKLNPRRRRQRGQIRNRQAQMPPL
jgi:hypothetical protein